MASPKDPITRRHAVTALASGGLFAAASAAVAGPASPSPRASGAGPWSIPGGDASVAAIARAVAGSRAGAERAATMEGWLYGVSGSGVTQALCRVRGVRNLRLERLERDAAIVQVREALWYLDRMDAQPLRSLVNPFSGEAVVVPEPEISARLQRLAVAEAPDPRLVGSTAAITEDVRRCEWRGCEASAILEETSIDGSVHVTHNVPLAAVAGIPEVSAPVAGSELRVQRWPSWLSMEGVSGHVLYRLAFDARWPSVDALLASAGSRYPRDARRHLHLA